MSQLERQHSGLAHLTAQDTSCLIDPSLSHNKMLELHCKQQMKCLILSSETEWVVLFIFRPTCTYLHLIDPHGPGKRLFPKF